MGIEEAFDGDRCFYCGNGFPSSDWRSRGDHLVSAHKFGGCDIYVSYTSDYKHGFTNHLTEYHAQSTSISYWRYQLTGGRSRGLDPRIANVKASADLDASGCTRQLSTGSSGNGTSNSEPSFVKLTTRDLSNVNDCFRNADVDKEISRLGDLNQSTLRQFWEADWRLNCILERYIINEAAEMFCDGLPSDMDHKQFSVAKIITLLPSSKDLKKTIKVFTDLYLYMIHEGFPAGTTPLDVYCSDDASLRQSRPVQANSLEPCPATVPHSSVIYFGCNDSNRKFEINPLPLTTERLEALTVGLGGRIQSWLCRFVGSSETARVLASRSSGYVTIERPHTLPWVIFNLRRWESWASDRSAF